MTPRFCGAETVSNVAVIFVHDRRSFSDGIKKYFFSSVFGHWVAPTNAAMWASITTSPLMAFLFLEVGGRFGQSS